MGEQEGRTGSAQGGERVGKLVKTAHFFFKSIFFYKIGEQGARPGSAQREWRGGREGG
jgi:hypothetical protein